MTPKIKGLKKAIGEYKNWNAGGWASPLYGVLMYDYEDGNLWADTFNSLGHNSWAEYDSRTIVNLGKGLKAVGLSVSMDSVKKFLKKYDTVKKYLKLFFPDAVI